MSQIVHRLCAEVVVDRNGQRVFPLGKKKIPQKEVRLVEINRPPPGKPTWKTGRLEIGVLGQNSDTPEWSTGLETLCKIDKHMVNQGCVAFTLKKVSSVPTMGFQSMEEMTMIILRQADSQNLATLVTMVDNLMTKGSARVVQAKPQPASLPPAKNELPKRLSLISTDLQAKTQEPPQNPQSKWMLPKELEEFGKIPVNPSVVSKISLREHRLMKMGVDESDEEYAVQSGANKRYKQLPIHEPVEPVRPERARFELLYSQLLLHRVLAYLTQKESYSLGLINKKCHSLYCGMRRELNYSRFTEVPEKHLMSLIKKCNKVERIVWGRLQGFKSAADKFVGIQATNLIHMDCSVLNDFKDSTVVMFTKFAPNLKELSVPYYSMTSHSMLMMIKEFPRLEAFRALHFSHHRSSGVLNEKLSAKSVSEFLYNKPYLREFEIFCLESSSLNLETAKVLAEDSSQGKLERTGTKLIGSRSEACEPIIVRGLIKTLTIHNLLARSVGSLSQLELLGTQFPGLQSLSIGSIYMTPFQQIPSPPTSNLKSVLEKLPKSLTGLGLGEFVDDSILASVPKSVKELSLSSPLITDEGFGVLLHKMNPKRLDLRGCHLLSWEAFKTLEAPSAQPVVANHPRLSLDIDKMPTQQFARAGLKEVILRGEKSRAEEVQLYLQEKGIRGCRVVNYEPTSRG